MIGIYIIENLKNGKIYIGQSKNIKHRWGCHIWELKNNKHHNYYLQNTYNKYGIENFKFEILEECSIDILDEREIYYISFYNSTNVNFGYNLVSGGNLNKEFSDETKKKISESKLGHSVSEETRQKLRNVNLGKTHSEETKNKLREKSKNISEETRLKLSQANLGRKHTEETRKKISESSKGKIITYEQRLKSSQCHLGKKLSEETKQKIGEASRGINNYKSKLTDKQVKDIREKYIPGIYTAKMLAIEYNLSSKNTILNIVKNKSYYDENYIPPENFIYNKIEITQEMIDDKINGMRRKDWMEKYNLSQIIWDKIKIPL